MRIELHRVYATPAIPFTERFGNTGEVRSAKASIGIPGRHILVAGRNILPFPVLSGLAKNLWMPKTSRKNFPPDTDMIAIFLSNYYDDNILEGNQKQPREFVERRKLWGKFW